MEFGVWIASVIVEAQGDAVSSQSHFDGADLELMINLIGVQQPAFITGKIGVDVHAGDGDIGGMQRGLGDEIDAG